MRLLRGVLHVRWLFEWMTPLRSIASSLRRLQELKEIEMEAQGLLLPKEPLREASVSYQDDIFLSDLERRQLEWIAAGRRPLGPGEEPPGVPQ